jgi:branched-chain amino acid aminotransferase
MDKPLYYFVGDNEKVDLDFSGLGFDYLACPYRFEAVFDYGVWRVRGLLENKMMEIPEGSQGLHYGHQIFEGMRVVTGADGKVYAFRPWENARRINQGARYLKGAEVPEELFIRGIEEAAAANLPFIPPHGSGASLYVRPLYLGIGDNVGVKPATRFVFRVMVCPVGPYYKGGFGPQQGRSFVVSEYDRAAPRGTGHIKAGGNYASSFFPGSEAKAAGFTDAIFLDPAKREHIDEIGAANFLAFKGSTLITPDSPSALKSITRRSILEIGSGIFGWPTEERLVALDELDDVDAAACCGTAAILTWIKKIADGDREWEFPFDERWQKLHDKLVGIQTATDEDPFGWRHEIPV